MKLFFASVLIVFCTNVFAQDSVFYLCRAIADTVQPVKAQFPGGDSAWNKFYAETMKYPAYALEHKVEGTVYVSFIVEEDGTLTHVQIVETPHRILCDEALRIVKLMPKWQPSTQNGKPIKSGVQFPITFKIR